MVYSKGRLKAMAIKKLLLSNHSEWELYHTHILMYMDFTVGFSSTHLV